MTRRRSLVLLAAALLVIDALFLGWRWYRESLPNAQVTYLGIDSGDFVVDADTPVLRLQAGRWYLGDKPIADPAAYARRLRNEGHLPVVSTADYARLVPTIRDLKARKICNILIREGGRLIKATPTPEVPDWDELGIPAFVLCGNPTGDAGFYGTLPPDGPIHVPPGPSLR